MALIHCDFFSEVLEISTSMDVILPQKTEGEIGIKSYSFEDKYPTLYLLHGLSDDHTAWQRRTSIERYVAPLGLAVVMPAVNRSFYSDMVNGAKYWTFISKELPQIARSFFPLSDLREDNFVAGNSMGGYGAFKLVLNCPDKFAAGASLSGAVDVMRVFAEDEKNPEVKSVFGKPDNVKGSNSDLFYVTDKLESSTFPKPKLYQCCGTEDFLYEDNIRFRDYCQQTSLDLTYEEDPAAHEWGYWDQKIQDVLEWLPLGGKI